MASTQYSMFQKKRLKVTQNASHESVALHEKLHKNAYSAVASGGIISIT
jgi:hypothetical protein